MSCKKRPVAIVWNGELVFLVLVYELKMSDPQKDEAEQGENKRLFTFGSPDLC